MWPNMKGDTGIGQGFQIFIHLNRGKKKKIDSNDVAMPIIQMGQNKLGMKLNSEDY